MNGAKFVTKLHVRYFTSASSEGQKGKLDLG